MKIAFIGGGSVKWTSRLVVDMILNKATANSDLVLHDIDEEALNLLSLSCRLINEKLGGRLNISVSLDRKETLRDADFVILCVAIGGLTAMRNDLLIPEKYGIYQPVGDTVGPGGLSRALRHIPFAVKLAREMEELCPSGWLINLTNPMTAICRGISRTTGINVVGLCHEVDIFRDKYLAPLLKVPSDAITFHVAGINHLPVIINLKVDGQSGISLLQDWMAKHCEFDFVDHHVAGVADVFADRLAVKLHLFKKNGVLFGAGDRHVAEFFPDFLTEGNHWGGRFGVLLTTIDHREELALQNRREHEDFVNGGHMDLVKTDEQLIPVIEALSGGSDGIFVVNNANDGCIENLPSEAVVEHTVHIDESGVHQCFTDKLNDAAYRAVSPHVARQEIIVEAALSGESKFALEALSSEPLVTDPTVAAPLLEELQKANDPFMKPEFQGI